MVAYEEAVKLAKGCWSEVDYVTEFPSAYMFSKFGDRRFDGNGLVVVLKDTGGCFNYVSFEMDEPDLTVLNESHI
ncbi:MAG TPA: hypothetical protein IAC28_09055 [Candidatus Aphodovivens excrementavium]|nr:hypothetical protein [Candidatus Aphodovivens excrementavium]